MASRIEKLKKEVEKKLLDSAKGNPMDLQGLVSGMKTVQSELDGDPFETSASRIVGAVTMHDKRIANVVIALVVREEKS